MRIVDQISNSSELIAEAEIERIAQDNGFKIFTKIRISDVLFKEQQYLTPTQFSMFSKGHFDFVIADKNTRPILAIEYDGPLHSQSVQTARDETKDWLCKEANFPILRINDSHVTRLYRGMTVLRWIIEVVGLEEQFVKAQSAGFVPDDEPFDPGSLYIGEKKLPYLLSLDANRRIRQFLDEMSPKGPVGCFSFSGTDCDERKHRLSVVHFNGAIIYSRTSIRKQGLSFPDYELLDQIDACELDVRLKDFRAGVRQPISIKEFTPLFRRFCEEKNGQPTLCMGAFPLNVSWSNQFGWRW